MVQFPSFFFLFSFFFNDTATTEIYTLSLHDALPICVFTSKNPPMSSPINSPQDRYCQFHATFSLPSHCAPSPGNGGHGGVRSLALSPHQQWLASGGDDGRVAIHSTKKLQERAEFDAASEIMPGYNVGSDWVRAIDRKSTRLNSSH